MCFFHIYQKIVTSKKCAVPSTHIYINSNISDIYAESEKVIVYFSTNIHTYSWFSFHYTQPQTLFNAILHSLGNDNNV